MSLVDEALTGAAIGAYYKVYNRFGFGFLETVYRQAMGVELRRAGLSVARESSVGVFYDGVELCQYRMDMIVEGRLLIEIKSTQTLHPSAIRQVHNYLRATNLEVALLLHFGPEPKFFRLYSPNTVNVEAETRRD